MRRVPLRQERRLAVNHELRFTVWLRRHALSAGAYLPARSLPNKDYIALHDAYDLLIDLGIPILKRDLLTGRNRVAPPRDWQKHVAQTGYPVHLMTRYLERIHQRARADEVS